MRRNTCINIILTAVIAATVVVCDQLTKLWVLSSFELGESREVIPGILNWTYIRNEGAAMGMLSDHRWIFMILSALLILVIVLFIILSKDVSRPLTVVLAAILGGGIGNMIDRFAYGYVVDFIDVKFLPFWKWIFNVADIFVTVGAILLAVVYIATELKHKKETGNDGTNV
ncbi:MAG: signal peptidase II [Clostridia bacterium]|nr:signal peptidase II [Clostridia bacterium]